MKAKFDKFVHEFTDANGVTRYAVADWIESAGQYQAPLDSRTRELTGCHTEFSSTPAGLGGYTSRRRAMRRARYLFGQQNEEE